MKKAIRLILFILLCQSAGLLGTLFTLDSITTWYQFLNKPEFSPPNWLFGPVWTLLYTLMGISIFLIYEAKTSQPKTLAYTFFGIQLGLNALWSIIFFGLQQPVIAFINIILMWIFIILSIIYFYKINKTASLLLIPYLAWVSFASVLNYFIIALN